MTARDQIKLRKRDNTVPLITRWTDNKQHRDLCTACNYYFCAGAAGHTGACFCVTCLDRAGDR